MPRHRTALAAVVLVTAACLAGCSSQSAPSTRPAPTKKAAEPASAPPATARPAGVVVRVGSAAEGIAYDPVTELVAVAVREPNRLQLLDGSTLAVRRSVALPGHARHLQLAADGGPVLVPDESAAELVQVGLPAGAITATTRVGKQPHDASLIDGYDVVGNEFGRSLSIIRAGRVVRTLSGVRQPGGVVGYGDTAVVVDVHEYTVSTFDLRSFRRTALLDAGKGPTHDALLTGGRVLVVDTRGDAVRVYGVQPLRKLGTLALPGTPYGIATDPTTNTVWVTLTARNQVVGIDVAGNTPRVIARYPTVRQPNTVAVAPGSHTLWITGTDDGVVQRITR